MKKISSFTIILSIFFLTSLSFASPQKKIDEAVRSNYPPAVPHGGLNTAYDAVIPEKMRGYVVILKGGIPAERARFFINWDEYDYRGVEIRLDGSGEVTTRVGAPYVYLQVGDVMAVAGIKYFSRTIYLKLLSAEVYQPYERETDKHFSRVSVMLGFRFPKEVMKGDNAEEVLKGMGEWLKPFQNADDAKAYSLKLNPKQDDRYLKLKTLEQKIDAARKQMDDAEKELNKMKKNGK